MLTIKLINNSVKQFAIWFYNNTRTALPIARVASCIKAIRYCQTVALKLFNTVNKIGSTHAVILSLAEPNWVNIRAKTQFIYKINTPECYLIT